MSTVAPAASDNYVVACAAVENGGVVAFGADDRDVRAPTKIELVRFGHDKRQRRCCCTASPVFGSVSEAIEAYPIWRQSLVMIASVQSVVAI
jgi:hypothetical protein